MKTARLRPSRWRVDREAPNKRTKQTRAAILAFERHESVRSVPDRLILNVRPTNVAVGPTEERTHEDALAPLACWCLRVGPVSGDNLVQLYHGPPRAHSQQDRAGGLCGCRQNHGR